jgi:uncharacterized membrane protein YeaQ/YmgE (transglycosylase-associated protein family)
MGIIAWVFVGLLSGLAASRILPVRQALRLVFPCLTGITGAVLGGSATASLIGSPAARTFFSIPAWIGALIGAAILLLAYRPLMGRPRQRGDSIPVPVPVPPNDPPR